MDIHQRNIELMYEVGTLRYIPRMWRQFLNKDFANLAEHTLRVMWLSLLIAKYENVASTDKITKIALIHDISESRTGDVHYLSRQYTDRHEDKAVEDVFEDTIFENEFLPLIKEYELRETIESKIVKDADNLDVDFELKEQASKGWQIKDWVKMRVFVSENKLHTETAKSIWRTLQTSDPHDWHSHANNRFVTGDWSKK